MGNDHNEPKGWSPYVAGALVGVLMVMSVWVTGKYFGASTTFVRATGLVEQQFDRERVAKMDYFKKEMPKFDWQFLFVVGIFFGSLIAATTSKSFRFAAVPPMWATRFGPSAAKRGIAAFLGGAIAMFGARLADGCPSGHGLSGTLQLSVSGLVALVCFFIGGVVVANMLYAGGNK